MTWTATHRRGDTLRAVAAIADERLDGVLPTDVEGVAETFVDDLDLVAALQLKWHSRLSGRIEAHLADQPLDLEDAVVTAWAETAALMPGVRLVLDRAREEPTDDAMAAALTRATTKEHALLAMMAGRASVQDWSGAPIGARMERRARLRSLPPASIDEPADGAWGTGPRTLLRRLRALVAA